MASEEYGLNTEVSSDDVLDAVDDGDISQEDADLITADFGEFVSVFEAVLEEDYFREILTVVALEFCDSKRGK